MKTTYRKTEFASLSAGDNFKWAPIKRGPSFVKVSDEKASNPRSGLEFQCFPTTTVFVEQAPTTHC